MVVTTIVVAGGGDGLAMAAMGCTGGVDGGRGGEGERFFKDSLGIM